MCIMHSTEQFCQSSNHYCLEYLWKKYNENSIDALAKCLKVSVITPLYGHGYQNLLEMLWYITCTQ